MVRAGLILLLVVTVFLGLVVGMSLPLIPSGTWAETGGTMGAARRGAASVLLGDGTVLVLGGVGSDGSVLASAELLTSGGVFVPSPEVGRSTRRRHRAQRSTIRSHARGRRREHSPNHVRDTRHRCSTTDTS
jgi:hypothetical protein